jgi:S1-C subfamily serine protease
MRPLQTIAILGLLLAVLASYPAAQGTVADVKRPIDAVVLSARDIARVAFKSVVLLEMKDSNGQPLSLGSGFFISNDIVATNAHVIEGASSGTAKLIGDTHVLQILGTVAVDRHADLALLKVNSPAPALVLAASASPSVGDKVYVVGSPLGLEGTFSEGIISAVRKVGADSILQMTAPISPGSSGGPVIDNSGAVIGVAVATFQYGQNLNLAVPASYLSGLLASPSKELSSLGNQKTSGQTAKSILDSVGTRIENAVTVSDYHLQTEYYDNGKYDQGKFEFRLTNKLPVEIRGIQLLILYYDYSNALMDFEKCSYSTVEIPAGLTKTIVNPGSEESRRAAVHWQNLPNPKVEIRVLGFSTEKSE